MVEPPKKTPTQTGGCKCSRIGCCATGKCELGNTHCAKACPCGPEKICMKAEGGKNNTMLYFISGTVVVAAIGAAAWYYMKKKN